MKTTKSFRSTERYEFDFGPCSYRKGWAQIDTVQDAHYFGSWANPFELKILTYAEGDITLQECESVEEFRDALLQMNAWSLEQMQKPIRIDTAQVRAMKHKFRFYGLGELLYPEGERAVDDCTFRASTMTVTHESSGLAKRFVVTAAGSVASSWQFPRQDENTPGSASIEEAIDAKWDSLLCSEDVPPVDMLHKFPTRQTMMTAWVEAKLRFFASLGVTELGPDSPARALARRAAYRISVYAPQVYRNGYMIPGFGYSCDRGELLAGNEKLIGDPRDYLRVKDIRHNTNPNERIAPDEDATEDDEPQMDEWNVYRRMPWSLEPSETPTGLELTTSEAKRFGVMGVVYNEREGEDHPVATIVSCLPEILAMFERQLKTARYRALLPAEDIAFMQGLLETAGWPVPFEELVT